MKKVLTIATICALSIAFTGCGKDETVNNNQGDINNPIVNVENTTSPYNQNYLNSVIKNYNYYTMLY